MKEIDEKEIEAPYELPEGWKWCRLGEVADWGSGGTPSRKNPEYYQGSIPWIKTGELNETYIFDSEEKVSEDAIKHSSAKIFPKETVVMAMYGATIGKTAIFGIDASTNQACACAICHKELDNHFLFNFLKSKKDYFLYNAKGGAQPNISQEIIKNTLIPLPPTLAEQQHIVKRIESMFAKLDEAKEKAQNVVDGFETRKAAILHKAFTGELTAKWRKENGIEKNKELDFIYNFAQTLSKKDMTNITDFQKQAYDYVLSDGAVWKKCCIGAIGVITNGSTPSRKEASFWNGNIPWVSSGEVANNIIESTNEMISEEGFNNSSVKKLPIGTVLIAMIGEGKTRGQTSVLNIEATTNQNIAAIIINHGHIESKFLWYWLQKEYKNNRTAGNGSGPQALNCQKVRELPFILPTLPEQVEIVRILDIIIEKENKAKQAAETVLEQIDLLKKSILARAFRGEL